MATRLPNARPRLARVTEALTADVAPVRPTTPAIKPGAVTMSDAEWDRAFGQFLERVMAQAAVGGDPEPLKLELAALLQTAPPLKREELEKNNVKPPKAPDTAR